jgi:hypothetical protein
MSTVEDARNAMQRGVSTSETPAKRQLGRAWTWDVGVGVGVVRAQTTQRSAVLETGATSAVVSKIGEVFRADSAR